MNVESLLVTKNRDKFDRLISFMKSLIVKNEVEADNAWEAEDKAYALCDADAYAWEGSADEVIVEEMLD